MNHKTNTGGNVNPIAFTDWSLVCISRALRFYAEAQHRQPDSFVLPTISAYYSMFHLGSFLALSAPDRLGKKVQDKLENALNAGVDVSRALEHKDVQRFLTDSQGHGLPVTVLQYFKKAKELREWVNYGPDLINVQPHLRIGNRDCHPIDYSRLVDSLKTVFFDSLEWACRNGMEGGIMVHAAVARATPFFKDNSDGAPYYSEWSSAGVLETAEELRASLEESARKLVWPDNPASRSMRRLR